MASNSEYEQKQLFKPIRKWFKMGEANVVTIYDAWREVNLTYSPHPLFDPEMYAEGQRILNKSNK